MKKLSIALLGLVILVIVAILVGPSFIDWNSQKGRITAEVERLTGRKLTIDGDLSLTILPAPAFSAARVRFANIEGGSAPSMIELESLDIRIALIPLVQGRVEVESIELLRPTILVEVLADGRGNWEIAGLGGGPTGGAGQADDGSGGFFDQVRLQSVRISDGTLIYRDVAAGREERIAGLNAEIAAGSLNGPFAVTGDAVVRGIKTAFDVTIGQLVAQGATSLNVKLELPDAGAKARFGGAVSRHPDGVSLRGRLKAEGGSLAAVAALLAGAGAGPGAGPLILAQPFSVETELSVDLQQATASELAFRLGDNALEGEVRVKFDTPLDVRVNLSATHLDLDKLLVAGAGGAAAPATQQPATAQPPSEQSGGQSGGVSAPGSGPVLPSDVSATVELTVDALVYNRQVVRQLLVSMSLAGGQLRVSQALALLPGGSDVSVTGVLAPAKAAAGPELRFTGRLEAASDNLRGMLQWLGVGVGSVPPDRLRRMSLSAKIDAGASQATVSDIDLRIDVSRVTGGIAMALRERPGFGIGLAIDKLNLDAYLPRPGAGAAAQAGAAEEGQAGQTGEAGQGAPAGPAGPWAALAGFDANLDLTMGSLILRGVTARKIGLDATLKQGAVVIRDVTIGDLAGSKFRLSGTLSDLATTPSIAVEVALSVPDPGKLAKLVGQDAAALRRIGAIELTATVTGTLARVGLDATLTALGGRFGAAGTVQPLANPVGFDLKLVAKHPDLAELGRALDVGPALGPGLGGVELAVGLRGTPARMQIAKLAGNLGPATLTGGLAVDFSGPAPVLSDVDLGVALRHSDLGGLIQALSPGAQVRQGLGGVDLKGRITGGAKAFQIVDLAGRLGPADISGRLGADFSGAKPALVIELTTGELPLAALMAAGGGTGATGGTTNSGTASGGRKGRWSSDPIDVSGLNAVNAEIELKAQALLLENTRLDRVTIEASLVDGLLDLRKFNSTVYGGALAISGKVDARKTLEIGLAVTAIELDLARLLYDLAESDRVSGPLSLNASLSTRGRNEAELVAALTGDGKLDGTLRVKAKQEERVGSQLLGLAGALLGRKIKEFDQIRGLTDATNVLFNAFADAPAAVTGSFTVDRGVVVTDDLRVEGRQAVALTQARADLPRWLLDSTTSVYLAENPNQAYVTVGLRGPLDAPNPRLSGAPLQPRQQLAPAPSSGPAPSTSGQIQTAPQPAPQPAPLPAPETATPEDLLRQGLEQGLKKLFGN